MSISHIALIVNMVQLHTNAVSYFEQIQEATSHKTTAVGTLISHL